MSERGVFAVDRGIWEHDLLSDSEPFSRREAWLWLVSEAAWKPHRRRIMGRPIDLARGQLVGSTRYIASKWRWSEPKVRRFLAALISEEMIDANTDAGVSVITICKYDEYQRVSLPADAVRKTDGDAGATQERRKVEDRESREEKPSLRSGSRARGSRLPAEWQPSEAGREFAQSLLGSRVAEEIAKFCDYWHSSAGPNAVKLDWDAAWRNWCRKAATDNRPRAGPAAGRKSASDACDDLLDKLNDLDRHSEIRGAAGQTVVRLLPSK